MIVECSVIDFHHIVTVSDMVELDCNTSVLMWQCDYYDRNLPFSVRVCTE